MTQTLARLLYPRVHPRVRQKKLRFLLISIGVGLAVSLLFGCLLYSMNQSSPGKHGTLPEEVPISGSSSPATK